MIDLKLNLDLINLIENKKKELWINNKYMTHNKDLLEFIAWLWLDAADVNTQFVLLEFLKRFKRIYVASSVDDMIQNAKDLKTISIYITENTEVYSWVMSNIEYCEENWIHYTNIWWWWWWIVSSKWDLWFVIYNIDYDLYNLFFKIIWVFLWINEWIDVQLDNNDILLNSKKVVWWRYTEDMSNIHLSFTEPDRFLIEKICKKKMDKTPWWITSMIWKTAEDFIEFVKQLTNQSY